LHGDRCAEFHPAMVLPLLSPALMTRRISVGWGYNMSSISCARTSCVDLKASCLYPGMPLASATSVRKIIRLFAVVLGAASLAACAQSSVVTRNSEFVAGSRQGSLEHTRKTPFVTEKRVAATRKHTPFASHKSASEAQVASQGLASFYTEGTRTANGESFDTHELTAAHPTLPFGTRLRVTNVATGRSVTVRVNDRGPFVSGRVVDVSYAAAETLGMVGRGVAKVKLDVVQ
jgi:rare lipoprotein A